ncbi:MarR family winged helix-turn-helix transcriptional regulator [Phaeobacter sp. B1627]|uniref:MarR family winged helix-turn-helix transcriptional regulator n=1 Tax=Phaeobacter sp. B1627 TaxID=2583809 RepID=UPI001119D615|nr:GNAT family N-acetyltransferase [Phaeobacter sp. B1627]TNJ48467.1 GNAT family N-acetyltransferase [Phaeobacter sp. B1627]
MIQTSDIDTLRAASRNVVRRLGFMRSDLAATGLAPSAVHAVLEIGGNTATTARDLSEALGLEKSTVSRMLARLQRQGLITATAAKPDPRLKTLQLTEDGQRLFARIETFGRRQVRRALERLTTEERNTVYQGMLSYARALGTSEAPIGAGDPLAAQAQDLQLGAGYLPALLGRVTELHARYYSRAVGFGAAFECCVAGEMAGFLARLDETPVNATFHARIGATVHGSVSIEARPEGQAALRWFILSDETRGLGLGRRLLDRAMAHVDDQNVTRTELWTFRGLDAARHLYEAAGFELVEETPGTHWGKDLVGLRYARSHPDLG